MARVLISMPEKFLTQIDSVAEGENRTRSELIREALRTYIHKQKVKENALGLFKFIADIAAATIVGKRIIVPFIATPLAKVVQGKMEAHQKNKAPEKELAKA